MPAPDCRHVEGRGGDSNPFCSLLLTPCLQSLNDSTCMSNENISVRSSLTGTTRCCLQYLEEPVQRLADLPAFSDSCSMPIGLDETLDEILKDAADESRLHLEDPLHPLGLLLAGCNVAAVVVKPALLGGGRKGNELITVGGIAAYVAKCNRLDPDRPPVQVNHFPLPPCPYSGRIRSSSVAAVVAKSVLLGARGRERRRSQWEILLRMFPTAAVWTLPDLQCKRTPSPRPLPLLGSDHKLLRNLLCSKRVK